MSLIFEALVRTVTVQNSAAIPITLSYTVQVAQISCPHPFLCNQLSKQATSTGYFYFIILSAT
jgi:hypothetical protein